MIRSQWALKDAINTVITNIIKCFSDEIQGGAKVGYVVSMQNGLFLHYLLCYFYM